MYSSFPEQAKAQGIDIVYANNAPVSLGTFGYKQIDWPAIQLHWKTDALKNAIKHNELNYFSAKTGNSIYHRYKFNWNTKGWKNKLKTRLAKRLIKEHPSQEYIDQLRNKLNEQEQKTTYFKRWKEIFQIEQPNIVLCASQRPIAAVAAMQAAKTLKIPTICSIYSWDNLPKATLVVEADHYWVWSEHMKQELLYYYPFVMESQITVTGTPQFENHYRKDKLLSRKEFCEANNLQAEYQYVCFSGDDVTTSPYDPQYLEDVSEAIRSYNTRENKTVKILFRRCPVDFSDRYDAVLKAYTDVIVNLPPLWQAIGNNWDKKIPTLEDFTLQANLAEHTALVINVGSSMVFDFVAHNKPCAYLNYNPEGSDTAVKDINTIYKYIHFQSMPDKPAVFWLDNKESIQESIKTAIKAPEAIIKGAQMWFEKIALHPPEETTKRMVDWVQALRS